MDRIRYENVQEVRRKREELERVAREDRERIEAENKKHEVSRNAAQSILEISNSSEKSEEYGDGNNG